ncbi:aspartate dehydrogenase [Lacimicrobium alkaliphilum]|uniref:L-aspartate dehydrogenase n=1 Tax=Lacimicrobium alkaliphilum TaxID=1526571 RepID=A0ABQ1RBP4_9ALTE|nr:aspartate dehydrogenase [Lacimicrobium alkaliphilum]GGD61264.1 putative L-aspartate dehydrogenase [Lacimicrobium alkaliphilum]
MNQDLKVGIAGFGTIGRVVAKALDDKVEGLVLKAITSGNEQRAQQAMQALSRPVALVSAEQLAEQADIVVDCAPTQAFMDIAEPVLRAGKTLVTVSGAAILQHPQVIELARRNNGRIVLATGALLGLDAVRAAALGTIHSVTMVTRKPPTSLVKAKYIVENQVELLGITEPLRVFKGSAAQGAQLFPSNVNVAAALGLAGVGAEKTALEIWADPGKTRNTHTIRVEADSASFEMTIENVPTIENPGTGRITALSVIEALRSLTAPLRVGS